MNGKQAKRLRRAALGMAVVMQEAGRDIKKDGYEVRKHDSHPSPSSVFDPKGVLPKAPEAPPKAPSYQLLVRKDSVKGLYKHFKKGR